MLFNLSHVHVVSWDMFITLTNVQLDLYFGPVALYCWNKLYCMVHINFTTMYCFYISMIQLQLTFLEH